MNAVLAVPGVYNPIQSVGLGDVIPLQVAVTLPPAATLAGLTAKVAAGPMVCPRTAPSAPSSVPVLPMRIRDFVMPLRGSVIGTPVFCSAVNSSATVAVGFADLSRAQAPATCGVAIEVPLAAPYAFPGIDDTTLPPGASRLRKLALLETPDIAFCLSVDPTLIALEMHAGEERPDALPPLPAAMTVAMLAPRKL